MAVDFDLSPDQQAIADAFGTFFAKECPVEAVRAAEPLGHDPDVWQKLVAMGAPGMAVPVDQGGGEASLSELVVIAEAFGSALAPVPLIEHLVAAMVHPESDIVAGQSLATIALRPAVEGTWRLVPAGAVADVVVGVLDGETVAVRSTPPMAAPVNHGSAPMADRSALDDRIVLGDASLMDRALDTWRVLTAAALVGLADRAMRIGVEYVLERHQFKRPIASFQAVQHDMADWPGLIDGARFLTHKAAWAHDAGLTDGRGVIDMADGVITEFAPLASMSFLQAAEAATVVTDRSLHFHGGYGFSLEYDIQLFFRRARSWANIAGDPTAERLRLADQLWPVGG